MTSCPLSILLWQSFLLVPEPFPDALEPKCTSFIPFLRHMKYQEGLVKGRNCVEHGHIQRNIFHSQSCSYSYTFGRLNQCIIKVVLGPKWALTWVWNMAALVSWSPAVFIIQTFCLNWVVVGGVLCLFSQPGCHAAAPPWLRPQEDAPSRNPVGFAFDFGLRWLPYPACLHVIHELVPCGYPQEWAFPYKTSFVPCPWLASLPQASSWVES